MYAAAWSKYEQFAWLHRYNPLPVTFNSLSYWISEAVEYTKTETVRSYLTGLRSHHVDRGLPTTVFKDE
jgi:hypothetical protein